MNENDTNDGESTMRSAYIIGGFLTDNDKILVGEGDHPKVLREDGSPLNNGNTLELIQYYDPLEFAVIDHDGRCYDENTPFASDDRPSWNTVIGILMNGFQAAKNNASNSVQWPDTDAVDYEIRNAARRIMRDHGVKTLMIYLSRLAEDIDYWLTCSSFETLAFNDDNIVGNTIINLIRGGDPLEIISQVDMTPNDIRIVYDLPFSDEEKLGIVSSSRPWRVISDRLDSAGLPITQWLPYLRMSAVFGDVKPQFIRKLTRLMKQPSANGNELIWKIVNHRQDNQGESLRLVVKRWVCNDDDPELNSIGLSTYKNSQTVALLLLDMIDAYSSDSFEYHLQDDYGIKGYRLSREDVDWINSADVDTTISEIVAVFDWLGHDKGLETTDDSDNLIESVIRRLEPSYDVLVDNGPRRSVPIGERLMTIEIYCASNIFAFKRIMEATD